MSIPRSLRRTLLVLPWLVFLEGGLARAAGGERQLGPAPLYASFKLRPGYDALAELRKLLPRRVQMGLPLVSMGLARQLGFDPLSPGWMDAAGLDAAAAVWASLFSLEPAAARARLSRVEQAARRHMAGGERSSSFRPGDVPGPLAWVRHRLVLKLSDEPKARAFLAAMAGNLLGRGVLLVDKPRAEVARGLSALLGLSDPEAASLAEALLARKVALLSKPDRNLLALHRIVDGEAIIDLVSEVVALPDRPGPELKLGLVGALALPGRPALDLSRKGLPGRVFTGDAAAAVLLRAAPLLAMASEQDASDALRAAWFGLTPQRFAQRMKELNACRKSFAAGTTPVGDLGLQLRVDSKSLHGRAFWAAPGAVARAFTGAAARRDLLDLTEWQPKVVGLAGLAVEVGALLRALPRGGPFKLSSRALGERGAACPTLAASTILLGGWAGLLGQLKAETRDPEPAALFLEHGRNGVILLRDLSTTGRPGLIAQLAVAPAGAARLKESLARLAYGDVAPQKQTLGGRSVTIYPYLKSPLRGFSMGVTDLSQEGLNVTFTTNRWELPGFLSQTMPATRLLPPRILAFAHGQVPRLLPPLLVAADPSLREHGKAVRELAQRFGDLGANLSLSEGVMVGEVRVELK